MTYRLTLLGVAAALLAGCTTPPQNPQDPFEKFNRAVFTFNDAVDRVALKPAATAYKEVLPTFVQSGVNNFFGNLSDAWSGVNNLAQAKGQDGMSDLTRFAVNSTFGILGVLDIATPAGLRKHSEDLGQTLGYWGVPRGPYLMLPILGPSTVRDAAALPADLWGDPWSHKMPVGWRNVGIGVRAIDQRASILDASNLLEDAALDRYEFIRDGYLQRRDSRVYDDERSQEKHEKKLQKQQKQDPDGEGGKLDMKKAYGDDADATASGKVDMKKAYGDDAGASAPSGKVDMKKAYGDDADDAKPAAAGQPVPPPQQTSSSEKVQK
jgi:phospholipid-binding lipoprotein MlaA